MISIRKSSIVRNVLALTLTAAMFAFAASSARADIRTYQIGTGSNVDTSASSAGLTVSTSLFNIAGHTFNLDDGQYHSFNFFSIWTDEGQVNGSDTTPQDIIATLDFDLPVNQDVNVTGETVGVISGSYQYGSLSWDAPVIIDALGVKFEVRLYDVTFNWGRHGLNDSWCYGADVKAKVKQLDSWTPNVTPVPTPAALPAGLALMSLGVLRRRRSNG
ncbi:MAG: hypothetical protein GC162_06575 [Planctomycetes bacterium]|nr:hypothetical protein [Planctomycetota bacterium]